MNLYQIHGIFQVIAFLILFPLGAAIAYFRNNIGPIWRPLHIGIQLLAITFVFIAYGIVKYANSKKKQTKEKSINQLHKGLGYTVLILIILQLIWAFFGKLIVPWMTWYYIHITLSALIIVSGITNIIIAGIMMKS
jgi:cytochrome b561